MTLENIEARLARLDIILPESNAPSANYLPFTRAGNLVFIAGQTCKEQGKVIYTGRITDTSMIEMGQKAARICGLNLLVQLKNACEGELNRVVRCVRLGVFIQSSKNFTDHAKVADGVSDLMIQVFGEKGKHARTTVGCYTLPSDSMVEVDAIFEVVP